MGAGMCLSHKHKTKERKNKMDACDAIKSLELETSHFAPYGD